MRFNLLDQKRAMTARVARAMKTTQTATVARALSVEKVEGAALPAGGRT